MKKIILSAILFLFFTASSYSQLDNIIGKAGGLFNKGINSKIHKEPITTSFDDCDKNAVKPVNFGDGAPKKQLCNMPFIAGKGYQL